VGFNKEKHMDFDDFVQMNVDTGAVYEFFGVDENLFKIGSHVIRVLEDENDGYRSALGTVEIDPKLEDVKPIFFGRPIDSVRICRADEEVRGDLSFVGYELRSTVDGHVWLRFGTDDSMDYYPCFIFEYTPRVPHT
jgi:hypothetical protein